MDFTCVEIKNVKYIKLIPLDRKCEKELDLTTIHKDQELAYLNIFHVDKDKKKTLLKSIQINNIRPGNSGIPELKLSVSFDGTQYYKIVLKLNGYIYHNSVIDLRQLFKSPFNLLRTALIALAVLVVLFLGFFSIRTLTNNNLQVSSLNRSAESIVQKDESRIEQVEKNTTEANQTEIIATDRTATDTRATEISATDINATDTSATDTGATDTSATDTGATDTGATDTGATDTGATDTGATDTGATDTSATESSVTESSVTEPYTIETSELIDNKAIVYFYPNSSVLTGDAKSILKQVLDILNVNTNLDVEILGHCAFFGTEKGRQEISTERAENVYSFFISNGWTPENQPLLAGLGHQNIVTRDPQKQNLNRRVEINIKSK